MMYLKSLFAVAIITFFSNSYVNSQTIDDLANFNQCAYSIEQDLLELEPLFADLWNVAHRPGVVVTAQGALPFPDEPADYIMDLAHMPGGLFTMNDDLPATLEFSWADEENWNFNDVENDDGTVVFTPEINNSDFEILKSCSINDMARLKAEADVTIDGNTMHFTYRLAVVDQNSLYGVMSVEANQSGQIVTISRPVALTRISPK